MVLQVAREDLEESLERLFSKCKENGHRLQEEPVFLSRFVSGAFLSLLMYWLDSGMGESPAEMDERFRRLVRLSLSS